MSRRFRIGLETNPVNGFHEQERYAPDQPYGYVGSPHAAGLVQAIIGEIYSAGEMDK